MGRGFLEWQREQQLLQGQRLPGAAGQGNLTLLLFSYLPAPFSPSGRLFFWKSLKTVGNEHIWFASEVYISRDELYYASEDGNGETGKSPN